MNTNSLFRLFNMVFFIGILFLFSSCMSMMALPNNSSNMNHSNSNMIHSNSNMVNSAGNFDIVCGKSIENSQQSFSTQYKNKNYYFESEDCLNKFQQSPKSYTTVQKNNSLLYWGLGAVSMGVLMLFMVQ